MAEHAYFTHNSDIGETSVHVAVKGPHTPTVARIMDGMLSAIAGIAMEERRMAGHRHEGSDELCYEPCEFCGRSDDHDHNDPGTPDMVGPFEPRLEDSRA